MATTATAPVRLCGWDRLEALVADAEPPPAIRAALAAQGVRLHLPNVADVPTDA
ncbi:hypothetical protein [Streptomyces triticirhizae]|uniref:hypothetical protein n=1 Tax=Streptomyces triticirhizae TaxID=2483353 RepID=UPI0013151D2E|nr:hypothetical protein [Streptomyces triticirhizae]